MQKQKKTRKPLWFLKEWLAHKGIKQARLVEALDHSKSEISTWVKGGRRFNSEFLEEAAAYLKVPPGYLFWEPPERREALLVGKVGAGAEITRFEEGGVLAGIELPPWIDAPNVAEIDGDSQHPLQAGWQVFYGPEHQGVSDNCIGKLCVVQIKNGPTLLKTLKRGSRKGLFRLESWNAPAREDVQIEWAAKVLNIVPK